MLPHASYPLQIAAKLDTGTINQSVYVRAPGDKKSKRARLNWLLRQLPAEADDKLIVRAYWPGRSPTSEAPLKELRDQPDVLSDGKETMKVVGFEVVRCVDLGARMGQPRTFIQELESAVPFFYKLVVENLTEWRASPPRIPDDRANAEDVAPARLVSE
ncbi:MAG: hypothetical protein IE933_15250 [Sphingomonadales bacterium]|nr:hypothetical protein [Sphingomonadales bacterium]MBD3774002.1 hypothetical protein [Paracoccaceae bacterium]